MYTKDKVLVRDLEAPEIMGQVEDIIVGKTGTLTTGDMKVKRFLIEGREITNSRGNTIMNCEL